MTKISLDIKSPSMPYNHGYTVRPARVDFLVLCTDWHEDNPVGDWLEEHLPATSQTPNPATRRAAFRIFFFASGSDFTKFVMHWLPDISFLETYHWLVVLDELNLDEYGD